MLFAGTTEGRKLCEYLTGKNCDTYVYVTTEYGRELRRRLMCAYTYC